MLEEILMAHSLQREALVDRILAILEAQWGAVTTWDDAGIDKFTKAIAPVVTGAQVMTARMADAYIAQVLSEMTGKRVNPTGIQFTGDLRGIPTAEVYRRPFVEVFTGLKNGLLFADAFNSGLARLREIGDDDMSLAYRMGTQKSMAAQKIRDYRRVVRPELSKGGTCPLCHVASENVYHRSKLMPIHTHCRCAVMPIIGRLDPGLRLNSEDLGSLESPKEIPVVRNHGELGPILQIAGQHFTSEAQVA